MISASSNATKPLYDAEFRLHKYSSNIADIKYYRPEAGHTGKYCLRDFLENAKNRKYNLCITLNLRDDLGGKKFAIRPINEYVDAARQVANLFKQYNIKGFINLWSEPIYRYKISLQTAVDYILAVHHVIGDIPLSVPGEEINLLLGTPGFIDKMTSLPIVDILAVHDLTPTLEEINMVKQHWSGKIAQLETGSQGLIYDRPEVADWIYNVFKMYYNAGVWWCGLVYVDSWTDRNYAARWWDYNYTKIEHITPTYYAWLNARDDFGNKEDDDMKLEKYYYKNRPSYLIKNDPKQYGVRFLRACFGLLDGNVFDSALENKVKEYQIANNLDPDGKVGPITFGEMIKVADYYKYYCWVHSLWARDM
jgi:hypothetical protein